MAGDHNGGGVHLRGGWDEGTLSLKGPFSPIHTQDGCNIPATSGERNEGETLVVWLIREEAGLIVARLAWWAIQVTPCQEVMHW